MSKTALLVIDVQNEMFAEANPVFNSEKLIRNLQTLIQGARASRAPVIYVQHNDQALVEGTHDWQIHPSIRPEAGDAVIQKWTPDSFHETDLQEVLQEKGIEHLVVTGNQTEYCVDTTTRRAFSLGYRLTLVEDGHGTWDADSLSAEQIIGHHNRVLRSFASLKETEKVLFEG